MTVWCVCAVWMCVCECVCVPNHSGMKDDIQDGP